MAIASVINKMDITAKFIITIVTGLVILFSLVAWLILAQQQDALRGLMKSAESVLNETIDSNKQETKASEDAKVQQMIAVLEQISPSPVADFEISTLERYGEVMLEDPNLSYIVFFDIDGKVLTQMGDESLVIPENLVTKDLIAEELKMGSMKVGYNFDRLVEYNKKSAERQTEILDEMHLSMDKSLQTALWGLIAVFVLTCIAVAGLVAVLFRSIVIKRLAELESRMQDISEGEGDLRLRIDATSDDIIGRVGNHFNAFVAKMHVTIQKVVGATGQLTSSSEQMSLVSEESRNDINKQNSEIELAVTAITEMSHTVQEVARSAATAAESANSADVEANNGMQLVNATTESINELASEVDRAAEVIQKLAEDSKAIGAVLDVIRGIAEQTNLLALNAAIEAARAGEQGRGFAVVADEVRTLASRTQQSTAEIQQMIEKLQKGSNNAVSVMESGRTRAQHCVSQAAEAGTSLATITHSVTVISDMNMQIASAAEEQGAVSEEINRNIVAVHEIAGKSADGVEQTANASMELRDLSGELRDLVQTFRV